MKILFLVITLFLVSCTSTPEFVAGESAPNHPQLSRVEGAGFDELYVLSGDVFARYSKLYLADLNLSTLKIDDRRLNSGDKWALTEQDHASLQRGFRETAEKTFTGDKSLSIAKGVGEGTLSGEFVFTDFYPSASKDRSNDRSSGEKIFTHSVGYVKMVIKLTDASTGELVAYATHEEEVGDSMYLERNDRMNNIRKMKLAFSKWFKAIDNVASTLK
ncbi:DUF3313 family protein [Teredinibacter franksiae]|uniref:DUF3313 family protein n=1 Tax=Teredinibacter franksiae TaxID=2761453 RepID=UPI001624DC61|nr:DUF3313 family protein [Teredinibacter franksiae]